MTATPSGDQPAVEEYPQAIADAYPGWRVRVKDDRWTAWCPAVTVHAGTPAALRAAIEHAIKGDDDTP